MARCKECAILQEMNECDDPCACAWYLDNVLFGDKRVEDCTAFKEKNIWEGEK